MGDAILIPFGKKVVVEPIEKNKTEGGILLPDGEMKKTQLATVIAIGPGPIGPDDQHRPMPFAVGDVIVKGKWTGVEVSHGGKEFLILDEEDVLCKVPQ